MQTKSQISGEWLHSIEKNWALAKILYEILHYLISIPNYKKSVHKTQFHINQATHLWITVILPFLIS